MGYAARASAIGPKLSFAFSCVIALTELSPESLGSNVSRMSIPFHPQALCDNLHIIGGGVGFEAESIPSSNLILHTTDRNYNQYSKFRPFLHPDGRGLLLFIRAFFFSVSEQIHILP